MVFNIFCLSLVSFIAFTKGDVLTEKDLKWSTFTRRFPYHLEGSSAQELDNAGTLGNIPNNVLALWENETLDSVMFGNYPVVNASTGEHKCNVDLLYMLFNMDKMWFIEMLDAAGKPPAGIMRGGITWLGNSKECKDVVVPVKNIDVNMSRYTFGGFTGQQCLLRWNLTVGPQPQSLTIGICVPSSCNGEYLKSDSDTLGQIISKIVLNETNSVLKISDIDCSDHVKRWTGGDIAYMCILTIFCVFIIAGTLCDIWDRFQIKNAYIHIKNKINKTDHNQYDNAPINIEEEENTTKSVAIAVGKEESDKDDEPLTVAVDKNSHYSKSKTGFIKGLLICFSAYTNAAKLINVENQQGQLNCIHGVRFLSMSWVILGHTFVFSITYLGNAFDEVAVLLNSFSFQAISQGTFSVDTFFFLSGFLLAYLFLKEYSKSDKEVSWIYFYVHRIWRLSPAFYMILGFYITLWLHLGSGPLWPTETENGNCEKNWWWDVLYIMNFQKSSAKCMAWVWYLANDMQFYVISPLFLIFLWKLPIVGNILVGVVMLASWITTGIISSDDNYMLLFDDTSNNITAFMQNAAGMANQFDDIYIKPYCRIGPYLVGILVGYALHKTNSLQKLMKMWLSTLGWLIALFLMGIVVFGVYHSNMGKITTAAYNSLSRSAWSIGVGWIVFACLTGHGGPVNTLLSWKLWVPLSRLTYCAYLVHPMVMSWYFSSLQSVIHFQMTTMVIYYFGFLLCSYLVAFVATLAFESPMMAVEKFVLKQFSHS